MENIFDPNARRWISPLTNVGASVAELKKFVQLNKNSLFVVDPTEGEQNAGYGLNRNGVDADKPEYMVSTPQTHLEIQAQAERLRERLANQMKNKWVEDDSACEEAVKFVGGPGFFDLRERKVAQKRGRQKAPGSGEDMEDENTEESEEIPSPFPSTSKNSSTGGPIPITTAGGANGSADDGRGERSIYEQFNMRGVKSCMDDSDSIFDYRSRLGYDDNAELDRISQLIPEALDMSDNENMDEFDNDNDVFNFQSLAVKMEQCQQLDMGLVDSDELDSVDENYDLFDQADEENARAKVAADVVNSDNGIPANNPGPSSILLKSGGGSSGSKKKTRKNKRVTLSVADKRKAEPATSRARNLQLVPVKKEEPPQPDTEEKPSVPEAATEEDSVAHFKRFTDWVFQQTHVKETELFKLRRPELMKSLGLNEDQVRKLQKDTSAFLATAKGEVFQDDAVLKSSSMPLLAPPVVDPSARSLQTLAVFLTHGEDPSCFPWKSVNVQQQINDDFVHDEFVKRMEQQKVDAANPLMKNELVDKEEDFLIELVIYQATDPEDVLPDEVKLRRKADDEIENVIARGGSLRRGIGRQRPEDGDGNGVGGANRYIEPKVAYDLHMLGSQTVKDLMNAIHCENDYVYLQDVPHPDRFVEDSKHFAKNKYPSSMILIHDTIYSDPNTSEVDYVSVVNKWAQTPPLKHIGPFKRGNLDTKLKDLELRFGSPYVYIHLGGCEHIFVFTKARLLHLEDDHLLKSYPKIIGMTRFKNIYCRVDNEYLARWAVVGFKDCPENPMLLCSECVLMYCYDKRKKKRGDFKLYPFTQMANIL